LPDLVVSATQDSIFVGDFQGESWQEKNLTVPGVTKVGQFTITAEIFAADQLPSLGPNSEDFDLNDVVFPIIVRPRQAGDRLQPFGGTGSKKVKDLFIDAH